MPTAREDIEIQGYKIELQIEFQIWCKNCGNGICGNTEYKWRTTNEFTTFCEECNKKMEELEESCSELESENEELKKRVDELEEALR